MVDRFTEFHCDWPEAVMAGISQRIGRPGKTYSVEMDFKGGNPSILGSLDLTSDRSHLFAPSCITLWIPMAVPENSQDWRSKAVKNNRDKLNFFGSERILSLLLGLKFGFSEGKEYQFSSWGGSMAYEYIITPTKERLGDPDNPAYEVERFKNALDVDIYAIAWRELVDIQLSLPL